MKLKHGVKLLGVQTPVAIGMQIADKVFQDIANEEMIVTSVMDGTHKKGSLHYVGRAFDSRTKTIDPLMVHQIVNELRVRLGYEWDVVLEFDGDRGPDGNEHVHVEFDIA